MIVLNKKRLRRNLLALLFIVVAAIVVLISQWYFEVNKYHDIEDLNSFRWQRNMNEEEFAQLEQGMTYLEVVEIAKGEGKQTAKDVYAWEDETLLTQSYELQFHDGKLEEMKVIEKHMQSTP